MLPDVSIYNFTDAGAFGENKIIAVSHGAPSALKFRSGIELTSRPQEQMATQAVIERKRKAKAEQCLCILFISQYEIVKFHPRSHMDIYVYKKAQDPYRCRSSASRHLA